MANTWCIGCLAPEKPRQLTGWIRTSIRNDFQGDSRTYFSSEDGPIGFPSDLRGAWMQGDLGVTAQVSNSVSFYGTFGGNVYLNGHGQAYNAIAGLRGQF